MKRSRYLRWISVLAVLSGIIPGDCFAAGSDELNDFAARLQFNFYAADARALRQDLQEIAKLDLDSGLGRARNYQLAYGQWKLAETLQPKDRSAARRAADSCVDAIGKVLDAVPKRSNIPRPDILHAESLAIQAGCFSLRGEPLRATKSLDEARALQPANPRILLVASTQAIERAKSAAERPSAERAIVAAVAAFDSQPPLPPGAADWGHAEALAWLGDIQLQLGNRIAARDSIERALVVAPDYAYARALLARATNGR